MRKNMHLLMKALFLLPLLSFVSDRINDASYQSLPFTQNWTITSLVTIDDNWSGVGGVAGYRGDDLTTVPGTDPQTILADGSVTPVDVIANQSNPNTQATGGVAEFDGIANPCIALQGSGTADAPHIVLHLNTTGLSGITVTYNVRDLDGSADNAVQPVALQYRVGSSGSYINIPAGFIVDATTGPSLATLVTMVNVTLPAACNNQPQVQLRIITTDAVGNDEWVGIDDINITAAGGLSASLRDELLVDNNGNGIANPNDQLRYTTMIRNQNSTDATGVNLNLGAPSNTTLNPSSTVTSALARDDSYSTSFNTTLSSGNVITNDFGLPFVSVLSFGTTASLGTTTPAGSGGTTDAGGVVTVNTNGTFTYTPAVGFSGTDQFMYIATTGVAGLPNNDAVVSITVFPDIVFSTNSVNPACNGASTGSITFNGVSGGSGSGYTYSITGAGGTYQASNVFNGLAAGTYNPAVKDGAGNIKTGPSITLTDPSLISFTHVEVNNSCGGGTSGSITFSAIGGTGTLSYSITGAAGTYQASNVFNGLASGVYNLAVKDANNCIVTGTATITEPPAVSFTFIKTDVTCFGAANGSIVFNAPTGGTLPYTYSITGVAGTFVVSNSFTGLVPNTYTLVVKDANGCNSLTQSTTITQPAQIVISGTVPQLTYNQAMTAVTFTKTGGVGSPASPWSVTGTLPTNLNFNTATGQLSGTPNVTGNFPVTITYTDATGCTGTLNITIAVAPDIVAETYTDVGNTQLRGGVTAPTTPHISVSSVAANDLSNTTITYALVSGPTHGTITLNTDGTFLYTPALNNTTTATFVYSGTSSGVSRNQTATINFSGKVWYVQGGGAAGDGRSNTPLNSLPSGNLGASGDFIYILKEVSGTTPGSITLQASQQLIGAGATLNVPTVSPLLTIAGVAGNTPTLTNTITLANSVTVNGIDMSTTTNAAVSNTGNTVTGVNFTARNVTTSTGAGITLTGTGNNVTMTLASLTTNGAVSSINLINTAGTVTINGGSLTGGAGATFNISGGTVSTTYTGNITQATASQPMINIAGGHTTGTITFNTGTLNVTNGTGLQFDNADGTYDFNGTVTLNGGDAGIDILNGSTGTFNFSANTSITNPSGTGFNLAGATASNATITYSGSISDNTGLAVNIDNHDANTITFQTGNITGGGIAVANCGGGTINFSNPSINLSTGASTAVNLSSNTGATINFAATGAGLDIVTTSGAGFNATGGATALNITGTGNTISSGTGTALTVNGTTIGASNLNFVSISANGGANGIVLTNTGTTGGLIVTGTGSANSGGIIQNIVGADDAGATPIGTAIVLNNTSKVSIKWMRISGTSNYGIRGNAVVDFRFENSIINGVNGTNVASPFRESCIRLDGCSGFINVNSNELTGGKQHNFLYDTQSGTTNINFLGNNVHHTDPTVGDDGFQLEAELTAVVFANVSNNTFTAHGGDHFNLSLINNANVDLTFKNNDMQGGHAIGLGQGVFILGSNYNGTFKYDISDNGTVADPFTGNKQGGAIHVNKGSGTGVFSGQIVNNVIGNPAVTGSGSEQAFGIIVSARAGGSHKTLIQNNLVRQYFDRGIVLEAGEGSPSFTATLLNNTVSNFADATNSLHGIHFDFGILTTDNAQITLDVRNNLIGTAGNEAAGGSDFRMRTAGSNDVFVGGCASCTTAAGTQTFIAGQNPAATTVSVTLGSGGSPVATYNNGPAVPFSLPNLPTLPPNP